MAINDGRVVSNLIIESFKNEPLTIYGDGSQTRSFCYVADMVNAFVNMMEQPSDVTGPINLGNPDEFTIKQLAEFVIKYANSKSKSYVSTVA